MPRQTTMLSSPDRGRSGCVLVESTSLVCPDRAKPLLSPIPVLTWITKKKKKKEKEKCCWGILKMGAVHMTSWYPNSMEAILACHPALSTKWLDWENGVNDDGCAHRPDPINRFHRLQILKAKLSHSNSPQNWRKIQVKRACKCYAIAFAVRIEMYTTGSIV